MIRTIVLATIRQQLSQPIRLGGLIGALLMPLITTAVDPDPQLSQAYWATIFVAIVGTGVIGLEISGGTLGLVFTRPITRASYVLGRWSGISAVAVLMSTAQLAIQAAEISAAGSAIPWRILFFGLLDRACLAVGVAAVFVMLSCLGSGITDLVCWAAVNVAADVLELCGRQINVAALTTSGKSLQFLANPRLDVYRFLFSVPLAWSDLFAYLSLVVLYLLAAVVLLNRRELSYATG